MQPTSLSDVKSEEDEDIPTTVVAYAMSELPSDRERGNEIDCNDY
jgi:hypothetical protein